MTKSKAEEMARKWARSVHGKDEYVSDTVVEFRVQYFLAGMQALLAEAEKMAYPSEVDSDGEPASDLEWVKLSDLRKIMGEE